MTDTPGREILRQITYARAAATGPGRAVIRLVENATGRRALLRRARGAAPEGDWAGDTGCGGFWQQMPARFGISLDIRSGILDAIPANGPLVLVANHPFGILDGLVMGHVLARARGDFRILANSVFGGVEALSRAVLPIDFAETRAATEMNLATRATALRYLAGGGAIGIFPGGTVSTAARPFGVPLDPAWRSFTAKLVARSGATVVPLFYEGCNSRLFQLASHLSSTLRLALLLREFRARTDTAVRLHVGAPLAAADLAALGRDPNAMMDTLRRATYQLSPDPLPPGPGFDFGRTVARRGRVA
ncbi:lysophospholipid acyltransferase family protein [Frigidibacter sp. MR17.24]|uniref:lysophospholipid acyltransferase family protein n=1 Tax=Frigidibacter sp. MR17.24 TaxID=3127345 RepID=UPI003012F8C8